MILTMGIMLASFYIFLKSINYNVYKKHIAIIVAWCTSLSFLYAATTFRIPFVLFRLLMCITTIVFLIIMTKLKIEIITSAYLLSFGISYVFYYVASFIVTLIIALFIKNQAIMYGPANFDHPIYVLIYLLTSIVQFFLSFGIFRIRRFRKGFPFIFKKLTIVVALFFTGIVIIFAVWIKGITKLDSITDDVTIGYGYLYFTGVLISCVGIYILIRRLIKSVQLKRMRQTRERYLEAELSEKKEELKRLDEDISTALDIFHNFVRKVAVIKKAYENGDISLDDVENLQDDFQQELARIKGKTILTSTNINGINNMFSNFEKQLSSENIMFNLVVNGSIVYMIDHFITQSQLETLIGDHLRDAQIAVNAGGNPFRSIVTIIGLTDDCYEFTVFDSGIPFTVDTLMRLGTQRVTTHADNGGTGIGFMTTFETIKQCNASLMINEMEPGSSNFTKCVSIRFDGKNQYIIKTYRPDAFLENDRYIIIDSQTSL